MKDAIVFFSVVCGGLLFWFGMKRKTKPRFRRKSLLTGADVAFFRRLRQALPECLICPQVAVSALIEPVGAGLGRRSAMGYINDRRVGYAVFDEEMQLIAVIELDYRSRPNREEAEQDAYFASAGIRTLRFHAKHLPSETKIRSAVYPRSAQSGKLNPTTGPDNGQGIEFKAPPTPWRDTMNAHI